MPTKMQFLRNRMKEQNCDCSEEFTGHIADLILGTNIGWRHHGFMSYARALAPKIARLLQTKSEDEVKQMSFTALYNWKE